MKTWSCLLLILGSFRTVSADVNIIWGGGGGDFPTPFSTLNRKVELADGELYELVGVIVIKSTYVDGKRVLQPYLKVDLDVLPWLASENRAANPYYPLEGSVAYWKQYESIKIRFYGEAEGKIAHDSSGDSYVIWLKPYHDLIEQFRVIEGKIDPKDLQKKKRG